MVDPVDPPSDRNILAAELALGLLDGVERAEALRLCLSDPVFAADVEAWSLRMSPLLQGVPAVQPPVHLWNAVDARIGGGTSASTVRSLRWWRGGALASGAIAAALALFIAVRPVDTQNPYPVAVSQLAGAQGKMIMAIAYDPRKNLLRLSPTEMKSGSKNPELWVIPEDGIPRSLGIIPAQERELTVDTALAKYLRNGVTLAITMEDPVSAPHSAPTSLPILTGKITII
jgi:anti-sigma-K factor RskA